MTPTEMRDDYLLYKRDRFIMTEERILSALAAEGFRAFELPSGAGHDGMAMIRIADIGMIFVRCAKGISHNPAEAISAEDAETGARCLLRFIRDFKPQGPRA